MGGKFYTKKQKIIHRIIVVMFFCIMFSMMFLAGIYCYQNIFEDRSKNKVKSSLATSNENKMPAQETEYNDEAIESVNPNEIDNYDAYKIKQALLGVKSEVDKALEIEKWRKTLNNQYDRYIFVGDSRFVGMADYADKEYDVFICEVGVSFSFLKDHIEEISSYETHNSAIIIGLGINNLDQASEYIKFLEDEDQNSFTSDIYFLTVNPIDEAFAKENGYSITEDEIIKFNREIINHQGKYRVINTYSVLTENGYDTGDGIHYKRNTSEFIYMIIKQYFSDLANR